MSPWAAPIDLAGESHCKLNMDIIPKCQFGGGGGAGGGQGAGDMREGIAEWARREAGGGGEERKKGWEGKGKQRKVRREEGLHYKLDPPRGCHVVVTL